MRDRIHLHPSSSGPRPGETPISRIISLLFIVGFVLSPAASRGEALVPDGNRVVGRGLRPGREVRLLHSPLQDDQVDEESYRGRMIMFPIFPVGQPDVNKVYSQSGVTVFVTKESRKPPQ